MKTFVVSILLVGMSLMSSVHAAVIVNHNGSDIDYGTSWDDPSVEVETVLESLDSEFDGDVTLTLVNGFGNDDIESWFGTGVTSIILEELAGYKNNTTFGWYDSTNPSDTGEIFSGSDGVGTSLEVNFNSPLNFGFYIDPNGIDDNRMFTQNELNTHGDYQVAIFKVEELEDTYILGWEDLDLNGGDGGDRDYQDMIVRFSIKRAVPEASSLFLLAFGGLLLLLGRRR